MSSTPTERRQFLRSVFRAPVRLTLDGRHSHGFLQDISLKGALVEAPQGWGGRVGQLCRFLLVLSPEAAIAMEATVAHVLNQGVGLHCEHIDLDSMTHLRQLVEHNADDPLLLERDLATLVAH